jgi:lipopolysaccharide transport system permease protein
MLASPVVLRALWQYRQVLLATTRSELNKKYAGSFLGYAWIALHPLLFLGTYVIVFLLIFRISLPGLSSLGYVVFVFSGLIPFLTLTETATTSAVAIRQNIHLLKNVIAPVEIIPARVVLMALVAQLVGLLLCLPILVLDGGWSAKLLALPLVLAMAALFYAGLAMVIAPVGMIVPDLGHGVGIIANLLLFLSPIAFRRDMVPDEVKFLVDYNPVTYVIEAYRGVLVANHAPDAIKLGILLLLALLAFEMGSRIMLRFKASIVDYE